MGEFKKNSKDTHRLFEINTNNKGQMNFNYPEMNMGTMFALIGYMEKAKLTMLDTLAKLEHDNKQK